MKNVFLFLLIITICGSLTNPSLSKCTPKIKMMAYKDGKLVKVAIYDWSSQTSRPDPIKCWSNDGTRYVLADSIFYSIIN